MLILVVLLALVSLYLVNRFIKDKMSKLAIWIFVGWWFFWIGLSTLNLYKLYNVKPYIYLMLFLGIIMFFCGYILGDKTKLAVSKENPNNTMLTGCKYNEKKFFLYLQVLIIIILTYYFIKYKRVVSMVGAEEARLYRYSVGKVFESTIEIVFFNTFIEAFIIIAVILFSYLIVYKKYRQPSFILLGINIFLYTEIGSGRSIIIDILLYSIIFYLIMNKNKLFSYKIDRIKDFKFSKKRIYKYLPIVIFIMVVLSYLSWITSTRMGGSEFSIGALLSGFSEFFKQIILYFNGPFRAFQYGVENYGEQIGLFYSRATFAGIDEIVRNFIRVIGIDYMPANSIIGDILQNNQIPIGTSLMFNYAYTYLMIFYFDFKIVGIIIFPILYGFFIRIIIFIHEKERNIYSLMLLAFLINSMVYSVFKWPLQSPSAIIVITIFYLFTYGKHLKILYGVKWNFRQVITVIRGKFLKYL
ncbi:O-antigen polymerase [Alloiococcus sp. CFN-8]|uniref:O-antigen polymerase n=1 Tax=Alloiococcus sp. CFN-8 TaxID=3416081 RepID=UPI003CF20FD8